LCERLLLSVGRCLFAGFVGAHIHRAG